MMAGDEPDRRLDHARDRALDSGAVCVQEAEPIRSGDDYGTLAARLERLGRRPARAGARRAAAVHRAGRVAGHIRAQGRGRRPRARPRRSPEGSSEPCGRCGRTSARASRCRTETFSASSRHGWSRCRRARAGRVQVEGGRLLLGATGGALELTQIRPPGGRRWRPPNGSEARPARRLTDFVVPSQRTAALGRPVRSCPPEGVSGGGLQRGLGGRSGRGRLGGAGAGAGGGRRPPGPEPEPRRPGAAAAGAGAGAGRRPGSARPGPGFGSAAGVGSGCGRGGIVRRLGSACGCWSDCAPACAWFLGAESSCDSCFGPWSSCGSCFGPWSPFGAGSCPGCGCSEGGGGPEPCPGGRLLDRRLGRRGRLVVAVAVGRVLDLDRVGLGPDRILPVGRRRAGRRSLGSGSTGSQGRLGVPGSVPACSSSALGMPSPSRSCAPSETPSAFVSGSPRASASCCTSTALRTPSLSESVVAVGDAVAVDVELARRSSCPVLVVARDAVHVAVGARVVAPRVQAQRSSQTSGIPSPSDR